jgi:hypothetical protein
VLVEWSDIPNFRSSFFDQDVKYVQQAPITNGKGWHQAKVCHFGICELAISTRAQHPNITTIYVFVTPISSSEDNSQRFNAHEKPTNYRIKATTGSGNCGGVTAGGFCSDAGLAGTSYWNYRWPVERHLEAKNRFDCLQCRCPIPDSACNVTLKRFSCYESFRECDADGFWIPICRDECNRVTASCTSLLPLTPNCACDRTEFNCQSARYLDTEPCTGVVNPPTPTVTPTPIVDCAVNEDDFVNLEIDYSEAAVGPVRAVCDEDQLEQLIALRLGIRQDQVLIRDLFVFVAQVRIFGGCKSATQTAIDLINLVNSRPLELVGTCLEQARAVIATPPLPPPSELVGPSGPPSPNDGSPSPFNASDLVDALPPIIVQFVPASDDISAAPAVSISTFFVAMLALLVALLF